MIHFVTNVWKRMLEVLFVLAFVLSYTKSQENKEEHPLWMEHTPSGYLNDYFIGIGTSETSEAEAHERSLVDALQRILQTGELIISSSLRDSSVLIQRESNQSRNVELIRTTAKEIAVKGQSVKIKGLIEEERYSKQNGASFTVWSLVKIPKKYGVESPPNSFSPVWRSVLIPGWGQLYKNQKTKGFLVLGSEVILISGAFISQSLMISARNDALNSRTQTQRDYYNSQASLYQNISVASFIATGAIYIFNIADALSSTGDKVYVDQLRESKIYYTMESGQTFSVTFSIHF